MQKDHLMVLSICPDWAQGAYQNAPADNWLCIADSRYHCWQVAQDLIDGNPVVVDDDGSREGFSEKDCWVLSCDFYWPENGIVSIDVGDDQEYEDDIFSRIDSLSEMVSQDPDWLGGLSQIQAAQSCSWLVGDLLGLETCQEGVDFWQPSCVPYVEWRAPLYGGRFRTRKAS
jgi:hypothetical protein